LLRPANQLSVGLWGSGTRRVEELAARNEESWHGFFEYLRGDGDAVLVTREQAAKILASSLRLEKRGELPKPQHFGVRTVSDETLSCPFTGWP